jgi:hypothetical protein
MKLIATRLGRSEKLDRPAFIRTDVCGVESPAVLAGAFERTFASVGG